MTKHAAVMYWYMVLKKKQVKNVSSMKINKKKETGIVSNEEDMSLGEAEDE